MSKDVSDVRARIIRAATELLARGGREAISTRSVSAAAGVQAPTIYRQFGDMQGLLDMVAGEALADYVRQKRVAERSDDPVRDMRRGWDHHVAFGLANPAAYVLMFSDSSTVRGTPAKLESEAILLELVGRAAQDGRLAVPVAHAASMMSAACRGVVLSLIATVPSERDVRLSADTREAVMAAILVAGSESAAVTLPAGPERVAARAVALHAVLNEAPPVLSAGEQIVLGEWLDRLSIRS